MTCLLKSLIFTVIIINYKFIPSIKKKITLEKKNHRRLKTTKK